jgi:hypothetical protein
MYEQETKSAFTQRLLQDLHTKSGTSLPAVEKKPKKVVCPVELNQAKKDAIAYAKSSLVETGLEKKTPSVKDANYWAKSYNSYIKRIVKAKSVKSVDSLKKYAYQAGCSYLVYKV